MQSCATSGWKDQRQKEHTVYWKHNIIICYLSFVVSFTHDSIIILVRKKHVYWKHNIIICYLSLVASLTHDSIIILVKKHVYWKHKIINRFLAIFGSVFIRDCTSCTIAVACGQFRTRDCSDLRVALLCTTQPIIESSARVHFSCLGLEYPQLKGLIFYLFIF